MTFKVLNFLLHIKLGVRWVVIEVDSDRISAGWNGIHASKLRLVGSNIRPEQKRHLHQRRYSQRDVLSIKEGICRELFSRRTLDIWIRKAHILLRWLTIAPLTMFTMISSSFRTETGDRTPLVKR